MHANSVRAIVTGGVSGLGLAVAAGTALVVDLDADGPSYPAERTLAQVVAAGPRRAEPVPERSGVAVLPNGGVRAFEALEMVEMLARSWPAVVVRAGAVCLPGQSRPLAAVCRACVESGRGL